MKKTRSHALATCVALMLGVSVLLPPSLRAAADTRPPVVQDTVRLRGFHYAGGAVTLSPDGRHVAYVLREPNLVENANDYVLHVLALPGERGETPPRGRGRELLRTRSPRYGESPNEMGTPFKWLGDGTGMLILHQPAGEARPVISRVDLATAREMVVFRSDDLTATDFAASATGDRLAVHGTVAKPDGAKGHAPPPAVLITPDHREFSRGPRELRVVDRDEITVTVQRLTTNNPTISLSPDGRYLTFTAKPIEGGPEVPAAWLNVPEIRERGGDQTVTWLVELPNDLQAGTPSDWPIRPAFDAPLDVLGEVTWSEDNAHYVVEAHPPLGNSGVLAEQTRLFAVDVTQGRVTEVLGPTPAGLYADSMRRTVISFSAKAGRATVLYADGHLVDVHRHARDTWRVARESAPSRSLKWHELSLLTDANDHVVVRVDQNVMQPPELYLLDRRSGRKTILTELNPELKTQRLGKVERLEWEDGGHNYWGYIVYPSSYVPGTRYPTAIFNKSWDESFIHGGQSGGNRTTFAVQALAGSDILVFMLGYPKGVPQGDQGKKRMSEIVDRSFHSARAQLDRRGLIDPARVGVMGYSSTTADVEHLISHPTDGPPWAASVTVDGGLWNYSLMLIDSARALLEMSLFRFGEEADTMDAARANLLAYAPAWNASQVRTPVLCSAHGATLLACAEFYKALWLRGKPVELFQIPEGGHPLEQPAQIEALMQRTVDWFRFWLQGDERPRVPEDPDRYVRWRELRAQHQQNERWIAEGKDPNVEWMKHARAHHHPPGAPHAVAAPPLPVSESEGKGTGVDGARVSRQERR